MGYTLRKEILPACVSAHHMEQKMQRQKRASKVRKKVKGFDDVAKIALHGSKFGRGSVGGLERHNERKNKEYSNKEIDPEKTADNYELLQSPNSYYKAVMDKVDKRINPTGRALRKDANVLCEFIVSSSNEFFKNLSPDEIKRYFEIAFKYLSDIFGKQNIIYSKVHVDEHTPHLHFGFVPLTEDGRLSAKEVIDRNKLLKLQNELPRLLKENGFDIERGEEKSKAKHLTVTEYKEQAELKKQTIEKNVEELSKKQIELKTEIQSLQGRVLKLREIKAINPQKTLTGAIKGASIEDIQDLQKTCFYLADKLEKSEKQNHLLKQSNDSVMRLKLESGDLKNQIKNLNEQLEKSLLCINDINNIVEELTPAAREEFFHKYDTLRVDELILSPKNINLER